MKKFWQVLCLLLVLSLLVACGGGPVDDDDDDDDKDYEPGICNGTGYYTDDACADPENWDKKWLLNRTDWDGKGMTIRIYGGLATEIDPNNADYSGERKNDKVALLSRIQAAYNVKIQFVEYPADAAWGPSRVQWINEQKLSGTYMGDIFLVDSNWIPTLAKGQSIARIGARQGTKDNLIKELSYTQNPSFFDMNAVGSFLYGYNPGTPRPDTYLYYNQDLIRTYNLDDPAEMWNANNWTWDSFLSFIQTAQARFNASSSGMYAFGGDYVVVALGMVSARGYTMIDKDTVYIAQDDIINTYKDLWKLYQDGYWETLGTTTVSEEFKRGQVLFSSGGLWFLNSDLRFKGTGLDIAVVPYPTRTGDGAKAYYHVPTGYEASWVFRPVTNGQNGLNTLQLLNIMDDYYRGLAPEENAGSIDPEEKYRAWLEARIDNEASVDAIMGVQDAKTYFEYLEIVSMTAGEGSHYKLDGFWLTGPSLIKSQTDTISQTLYSLAEKYRKVLNSLSDEV